MKPNLAPALVEQLAGAFAMYADENNLTYEQGVRLAEDVGRECEQAAEDRLGLPGVVVEHPESEVPHA